MARAARSLTLKVTEVDRREITMAATKATSTDISRTPPTMKEETAIMVRPKIFHTL